jgi:hypothetical protein
MNEDDKKTHVFSDAAFLLVICSAALYVVGFSANQGLLNSLEISDIFLTHELYDNIFSGFVVIVLNIFHPPIESVVSIVLLIAFLYLHRKNKISTSTGVFLITLVIVMQSWAGFNTGFETGEEFKDEIESYQSDGNIVLKHSAQVTVKYSVSGNVVDEIKGLLFQIDGEYLFLNHNTSFVVIPKGKIISVAYTKGT